MDACGVGKASSSFNLCVRMFIIVRMAVATIQCTEVQIENPLTHVPVWSWFSLPDERVAT